MLCWMDVMPFRNAVAAIALLFALTTCPPLPTEAGLISESSVAQQTRSERERLARQLFDRVLEEIEQLPDTVSVGESASSEPNREKIRLLSALALDMGVAGKPDWAEPLFIRAQQLATPALPLDWYQQVSLDALRRDILLDMITAGLHDRALDIAATVQTNLYRAEVLNAIATARLDAGEGEAAQPLVIEALQLARGVREYEYGFAYAANGSCINEKYAVLVEIADNFSRLGNLTRAMGVAQQVSPCYAAGFSFAPYEDYQAQAFLRILSHADSTSELDWLWAASRQMRDPAEQRTVWEALALAYIEQGETRETEPVVAIAQALLAESAVGEAHQQHLHWLNQLITLTRLVQKLQDADATATAEVLMTRQRELIAQLQTLERNHPELQSYTDPDANWETTLLLLDRAQRPIAEAQGQAQQGDPAGAIATLVTAWEALVGTEHWRVTAIRQDLIMAMAELGERDRAIAWTTTLPEPTRQLTHLSLTVAEQDAEQIVRLIRELSASEEPGENIMIYAVLNRLMAVEPLEVKHLDKIWQVWQTLELDAKEWQSSQIQLFLIAAYIRLGERDRGLKILGENRNSETLMSAINSLIERGEFNSAKALIEELSRDLDSSYSYHVAMQNLVVALLAEEPLPAR